MMQQARSRGGRTRTSQRPRRRMVAGCPAVLAVVIFGACCVNVAYGFSSSLVSCSSDVLSCLGNNECSSCLDRLQDAGLTIAGFSFQQCAELYSDVCSTADFVGCNTENADLVDLLTCVAEEQYGCDDFSTCEDATAVPGATPATATQAPAAPTFPTPVFPLPSAAPSPGPRGNFLPPTTAPTADGSGLFGTAFPSPAMFESATDTMAPSESSAAPTGVDGLRGGIGGAFSATPTAAPTGFENLDDLEDGANGGISSGHTAGTAAWLIVFATVLASMNSAITALAA